MIWTGKLKKEVNGVWLQVEAQCNDPKALTQVFRSLKIEFI